MHDPLNKFTFIASLRDAEVVFNKDLWAKYCDFPANDFKFVKVPVITMF